MQLSVADIICNLDNLAADAASATGQSYDLYRQKLKRLIDTACCHLSPVDKAIVKTAATHLIDYCEPEENVADSEFCSHGIEYDACPAGCGDLDHLHFEQDEEPDDIDGLPRAIYQKFERLELDIWLKAEFLLNQISQRIPG